MSSGINVSIQVNSTAPIQVSGGPIGSRGLAGSGVDVFDVADYGAQGDGTTDDSAFIQAAIDALETNGRGILYFHPKSYRIDTGLVLDPANLSAQSFVDMRGATLYAPNLTGDALTIESNVTAVSDQDAEKSYKFWGVHIRGNSNADSGIRLKSCFAQFYDTVLEDFTSVTAGKAALVLDALFLEWVEENHFMGLEIKNTGNGIAFISREDSGGAAASLMNNYFTNVHIWCKIANGKGVHGVGLGASTTANIGRNVFNGIVVHPFEVNGVTAFDFENCYIEGTVLISPSVDVYGSPSSITMFNYDNSEALTIISPSGHPITEVDTYFGGGGNYEIFGGNNMNASSYFRKYFDDMDDITDGATYVKYSSTEKTKLAGIEANADVTDTANVDAAGAVMNSDTSTAGMSFVIDEDSFASDLATKVPTQQSVKAYIATVAAGLQSLDADLTSWAAVTRASGFDTFVATPSGANLASLLTTALPASKGGTGLTALAANVVTFLGAADYAAMRTQLGLVIGTNVQAYDADLATIAGLTATTDNFMQAKSSAWASRTPAQVRTDLKVDTKTMWIVPQSPAGAESFYGDFLVRSMGTTGEVGLTFCVPADFASMNSVLIYGIPDATESIQYDIDVDIAASGEAYTTHTAQTLNATKSVTLNQVYTIDVTSLLSSALAGDIVGIRLGSDTDFMYIVGMKVIYNV